MSMLPCMVNRLRTGLRILLAFTSIVVISLLVLATVGVEAQQQFSSNRGDYYFGWVTTGIHAPGSVPSCSYCVNALEPNAIISAANAANGPYWNRTVGLYRCDGVQTDEMWAYDENTNSIVFSNLTTVLCIDALLWDSMNLLKLRRCNSSVATQRWKRDGHRVVSALSDSNGPLYLVGWSPNKATSPGNTEYTYPLMISSLNSINLGSIYSYTTNFTFLSTDNLVDNSTKRFTTGGLLQITKRSRDQIVNGGFESSTLEAGTDVSPSSYSQTEPSYLALCGWVIDYGPIDYIKSGLLAAANGSAHSVHLNTHTDVDHWGSVSQTFVTEAGREYILTFNFNGFPPGLKIRNCSAGYHEAKLQVGVTNATSSDKLSGALNHGNGFTQNFTFDVTDSDAQNIGSLWEFQIVMFTASTDVTTVSFSSLNLDDACGPMIDEVQVTPSESGSATKGRILSAVAGSIGGLAILIAVLGIIYGVRYFRAKKEYLGLRKTEHARLYSLKELSAATKKFSSVLGEGAFGTVYKADFPNGSAGAIKVEKRNGLSSSSKVVASDKIAVLLRVHHRNLVNLTGFCIHKGRHILVFEYLPNGSLYDRLHQSILRSSTAAPMDSVVQPSPRLSSNVLSWKQRVKIAADVAYGLDYLHNDADPPIIHRGVKSQNILLTAEDFGKLADFGLSKSASVETMVRGSIGYLDPQYFLTGVFCAKSDVYSFGVVLLELISGHQAIYNAAPLASWATPYMMSPALYHELVDKKLNGEFDANELESLVELSRMCMQEDRKMRPDMRQVVAFLNCRILGPVGEGVSEWQKEMKSRETYDEMNPMLIDFESAPEIVSSSVNLESTESRFTI